MDSSLSLFSREAPKILSIGDLDVVIETRDPKTGELEYITFYVITDDDRMFFGQLQRAKDEVTSLELTEALEPVPDDVIFPAVPSGKELTIAPDHATDEAYTKRPAMSFYELFKDDDFLARILLSESVVMERISQHPHPNIVKYYGVRVRRNRITGLVLEKHPDTLLEHVKQRQAIDEDEVMEGLESAVAHLHSLGLAHNDINPENIMVSQNKAPILIDFGSCQPFGKRLMTLGTEGWVESMDANSSRQHDIYAINKIREWLKNPWYE